MAEENEGVSNQTVRKSGRATKRRKLAGDESEEEENTASAPVGPPQKTTFEPSFVEQIYVSAPLAAASPPLVEVPPDLPPPNNNHPCVGTTRRPTLAASPWASW